MQWDLNESRQLHKMVICRDLPMHLFTDKLSATAEQTKSFITITSLIFFESDTMFASMSAIVIFVYMK